MGRQRVSETIDSWRSPSKQVLEVIGVFDSGVGGLAVLTEIRKALPEADLTYVADRARAPYGSRSLAEVQAMSSEVAAWLVGRSASTIVIACNTASAAALESLRMEHPQVSFVGMEPAVKPAASSTSSGVIGVLATAATFQGRLFRSVVERYAGAARVLARACPGWVELVEDGRVAGRFVEDAVRAEVDPLINQGADLLVIGCTHFSFLVPVIRDVCGDRIGIVDPSPAVAAQTGRVAIETTGSGGLTLAASGDIEEFARLAHNLAGVRSSRAVLPFPS